MLFFSSSKESLILKFVYADADDIEIVSHDARYGAVVEFLIQKHKRFSWVNYGWDLHTSRSHPSMFSCFGHVRHHPHDVTDTCCDEQTLLSGSSTHTLCNTCSATIHRDWKEHSNSLIEISRLRPFCCVWIKLNYSEMAIESDCLRHQDEWMSIY